MINQNPQGLLLVDKPKGISSFGVVGRVRGIIKRETGQKLKVGHSGTLDPQATGLLILAIGSYTKRIPELIVHDKTYLVSARLGQNSTTGDSEGELTLISKIRPSIDDVGAVLLKFSGPIMQTPPIYSAIKINGQRAYQLARKGKPVELAARPVTVYQNHLVVYKYPKLVFKTSVSSGTYVRSLVEDIGKELKTGAYTSDLRRESVGEYNIDSAIALDELSYPKILSSLVTLDK